MKHKIKILFYIYTFFLIFFVLFKFNFTIEDLVQTIKNFREVNYKRINLEFLNSIKMQINILDRWAILNLFSNTIPFIIYGFLFGFSFDFNVVKSILINVIFVLFLELIQLIFVIGTFDIDDIFLNVLSIIIGIIFVKYTIKNKHYI